MFLERRSGSRDRKEEERHSSKSATTKVEEADLEMEETRRTTCRSTGKHWGLGAQQRDKKLGWVGDTWAQQELGPACLSLMKVALVLCSYCEGNLEASERSSLEIVVEGGGR